MSNITLKKLAANGSGRVKKTDMYKVALDDVRVEKDFNLREHNEALEDHINSIAASIKAGAHIPPILARVDDDGTVLVIDGHSRREAYLRARKDGAPIDFITVEQFRGNDADRVATVIRSAQGRALTPLEMARGMKRLRSFGWEPKDIAAQAGVTSTYVKHLLMLGDAPAFVQKMVAEEKIAAAPAVELLREHGEQAEEVLREALATAEAEGKSKVTNRSLPPKGNTTTSSGAKGVSRMPPKKVLTSIYQNATSFSQRLREEAADDLDRLRAMSKEEAARQKVAVSGDALLALLEAMDAAEPSDAAGADDNQD